MGLIRAKVTLKNPRKPDLPPVETEAPADSGSMHLCIPLAVQQELQLEEFRKEQVTFADGSKRQVPYVGPVQLLFKDRVGFTGALVFGDEVLFGAIPMEDMGLHPQNADLRRESSESGHCDLHCQKGTGGIRRVGIAHHSSTNPHGGDKCGMKTVRECPPATTVMVR